MKSFFIRNIDKRGRIVRALIAVGMLLYARECDSALLSGILTGAGVIGILEALRGWCLLRACGIKTPL